MVQRIVFTGNVGTVTFSSMCDMTDNDQAVCGKCLVGPKKEYSRCLFSMNINLFLHLKLEIALEVPVAK